MKNSGKKKWAVRVLLLGLLLCVLFGVGAQAGWKTTSKGKRFYISKEAGYARGWKKINKKWYYFDQKGYLQKGWLKLNGDTYFLNKKTGERISGKWFSVGKRYYYAASNGKVQKNKWIGNYYVGANGRRVYGWLKLGDKTYYMNTSTGKKTAGCWKTIGKYRYYFMKSGEMLTNKWKKTKGKYYYLKADGRMAKSTWVGKYQVGKDGARTGKTRSTGLVKSGGKYYFYDSNYKKVTGWVTVNGQVYYFGSGGAALTGLQTIGGKKYYFRTDGTRATGLQVISGSTYYFEATGEMAVNKTVIVDGISYKLDADGIWRDAQKGLQIAQYALKFKGKMLYVYGGNSLLTGVDCSGFTQQVMKKFNIAIPRVADDQWRSKEGSSKYSSVKVTPDTEHLQAGDLIFYSNGSVADHTAIYIGDGTIVHAANEELGITTAPYNYRKILGARRYW